MSEKEIGNRESGNGKPSGGDLRECCERMAVKLYELEEAVVMALDNRPATYGEDWAHLMNTFGEIRKLCDAATMYHTPKEAADFVMANPPFDPAAGTGALPEVPKRPDWLEMPRGITLQRFVNTKRETHFIGQYRSDNKSNPNPRRVYTIDVLPMWDDGEDKYLKLAKAFEVGVHEDGKLLFKITTLRGRANAEYLGVKALKAWLVHLNHRTGAASRKEHWKRYRKAHRAEYRKRYKANLKARRAAEKQQKGEA